MKDITKAAFGWTQALTPMGAILFCAVIFGGLALTQTRFHPFWEQVPFIGTYGLNRNFMNFVLSLDTLLIGGLISLLVRGAPAWGGIWSLAGALLALNIIVELFVTLLNTRDVMDIYGGIAGIALGLLLLRILSRYCLVPKDIADSAAALQGHPRYAAEDPQGRPA
jgi:hypothetical protein